METIALESVPVAGSLIVAILLLVALAAAVLYDRSSKKPAHRTAEEQVRPKAA